jgi:hypothetical protein
MKQPFEQATKQEIKEFMKRYKAEIIPDTTPITGEIDEEAIPIYITLIEDEEWLMEIAKDTELHCLGQSGFSIATEELKRRNNYRKKAIINLAGIFTWEECEIFAESYCGTLFTSNPTNSLNLSFRIREGFHTAVIIDKIKLLDDDACTNIQLLFLDAWNLCSDYYYVTEADKNLEVNRLAYLCARLSDSIATDGKKFDL